MAVPKIKLNNGYEVPAFGLGTYKSLGGDVEHSVKDAIDCGYRHIDTAFLYANETEIGNAVRQKIAEGTITRSDVFITSKLWSNFHEPDKVEYSCRMSLKNLNLDYIDLYLIHWPFAFPYISDTEYWPKDENGAYLVDDNVDYVETYKAMEKLVEKGLVRSIGVSNFNSEQLKKVLEVATVKPVMNQVECTPALNQYKLIEFCKEHDIVVTAYSPLGRPNPESNTPDYIYDEEVAHIGKKYNKTAVQVVLRYLVQLGVIPIPKSVTALRIKQNIDVFDFNLTEVEMNVLEQFNTNTRTAHASYLSHSKHYPFSIEY